jgi:hypothetical protein
MTRTIFFDVNGEKLKTRDGDLGLEVGDPVLWDGKECKVTKVIYDAHNDYKLVTLSIDLKPE